MVFKRFRFNVILRVLVIVLAIFFLLYAWEQENWIMTTAFATLLVAGLVVELIRYVEKTNRDLQNFLLALKHKDFTHTFTEEQRGRSFAGLKEAFNLIIQGYQNLRAEKERHYLYLQNIIDHVSVALICYVDEGEVQLMNQAAHELLDRPYMSNIRILSRVDPKLLEAVKSLRGGERKLVKTTIQQETRNIALQATEFKLLGENYTLVSLQDIRTELDDKEIDTWHKLIRVLTHEIMNSVTPIISLTKVINLMLTNDTNERRPLSELDEDDADDLLASVRTIESRSKGLLHFVHAYRNLTNISQPKFRDVPVGDMVKRVYTLLHPELERRQVQFQLSLTEPELRIQADPELVEQVLINLVKNAMEVLEGREDALIRISALRTPDRKTLIRVMDNGPGIDEEFVDKIFIPFFTTKTQGSGIGLSLSRQIMRLHRGTITFQSSEGEGTTFTLTF